MKVQEEVLLIKLTKQRKAHERLGPAHVPHLNLSNKTGQLFYYCLQ